MKVFLWTVAGGVIGYILASHGMTALTGDYWVVLGVLGVAVLAAGVL